MPLQLKSASISLLAVAFALIMAAACALLPEQEPQKPDPISSGDYAYAAELAEFRIEQIMNQYHIPGAAAALIVDQEVIWQEYFGVANVEQGIPITEETIFKLWSLAKPFTAVETMRLVEEGQIDLDVPITEYVPEFTIHSRFSESEPITIRHLLAHRSGLPRNACARPDWHYGADALSRLAASLKECYLAYRTGERYKYSNIGYETLGYIIQEIRGQPFPVYMHDHLLDPLGMENSSFWSGEVFGVGELDSAQIATGYEFYEGQHFAYDQLDVARVPSSNLYATIADLTEFVRFIFRKGEVNGEQLVKPETLSAMFENQFDDTADPRQMGLGWKIGPVVGGEMIIWHDGGPTEGTGSLAAVLPESKLGVILLANSTAFESAISVPLAMELLEVMSEAANGPSKIGEEPPVEHELGTADLAAFEGNYAIMGQIMTVSMGGDQLKGSISGLTFDLVPVGRNHFRVSHWLARLGLTDLLSLPMDLDALEIEFRPDQNTLIVNFGGISSETGFRYPEFSEIPGMWDLLAGTYERYERMPDGAAGEEKLGEDEITIVDGRLHMSGAIGPILPINNDSIIILSGPFAGETITRDAGTGDLRHQGFVFKRRVND